MNDLPITALYAGILGLILVWLSIRVVQARAKHEVSLGDGGSEPTLVAQRGQGNFTEYVPLAVILIGLTEMHGSPDWLIHALGITLVAARLLHPFGLTSEFGLRPARFVGATATWLVIAVGSAVSIWSYLGSP